MSDAAPETRFTCTKICEAASLISIDPGDEPAWDEDLTAFLAPDTPAKAIGPMRQVFAVARAHGCTTMVLEHHYLDSDYRSEYAVFWSKRFEGRERVAQRLHFFTTDVPGDELHDLPKTVRDAYVGYSVLRPTVLGPIGRTVLTPPPHLSNAKLCEVTDRPSLFGNPLVVTGVPFCQQDGELLICAHTAAWLCHYVAHGRKIIGRKSTAEIVAMPSAEGSRHRPVPSTGLTAEQLQGIFSGLRIPAFFYEINDLPARDPGPPGPPEDAGEEEKTEHELRVRREEILSVVCKYLHSGFPVVVLTEKPYAHAFTLVGWRHDDDENIVLIACDDQMGPYEEITDPLGDATDYRGDWVSLMIPLPEKVFLTGEAAETAARGLVEVVAAKVDELEDGAEVSAEDADMAGLLPGIQEWGGKVSVRSRLLEGRLYKALLDRQDRSAPVLRVLRFARMPHWVWLVEFHDRQAREGHDEIQPCVLAELVFDSTSHDDLPVVDATATVSGAIDSGLERRDPDHPDVRVDGDGEMWRSMVSDPGLAEDEYKTVADVAAEGDDKPSKAA